MPTDAQVLGISSPPPVAGSPLLTNEMILAYCLTFFGLLIIFYVVFHFIKKPLLLSHKLKLVLIITLVLKISLVISIGLIALFWLLPTPRVEKTYPKDMVTRVDNNPRIEILFNRPINRGSLKKTITPDIPGVWTFEEPIYTTHLYRKLVFHPTVTLHPNTKYKIEFSNISNFLYLSSPTKFSYSFTTNKTPNILDTNPLSGAVGVEISSPIVIRLTDANTSESVFDFDLSPMTPLTAKLSQDKKSYILTPKSSLMQGVTYTLSIKKTDVTTHIPTNSIVERTNTTTAYRGSFTTKEPPGVDLFTPNGEEVFVTEPIKINFTQPMDRGSFEKNFITTPQLIGTYNWTNNSTVIFTPSNMQFDTLYRMKIPKDTKSQSGGYLTNDIEKQFKTIGKVVVEKLYPSNGWRAVGIKNKIQITFDQEVNTGDAQSKFVITPQVDGNFTWDQNTMIFAPIKSFEYGTNYSVDINPGVKSVNGLDSDTKFTSSFTTQDEIVKLAVPSYLQKYSLSCEIASLRMALDFKGVNLSEDKIIEEIGIDNTPKNGGIWGNPHLSFVGNVNGRQMVTGYGVYWEPIARVARNYRNAKEFRGWNISQVTEMLSQDNPVIIWVYSSNGAPTGWNTIQGTPIQAVRGEHAVVAVGYVGQIDNPTSIIVNDPLLGQIHWPRLFFENKWNAFGQSGVVIY